MIKAIQSDNFPHLLLLSYDVSVARVKQLILIPSFMFAESAIIKRRPLGPSARRAGWVGCILNLSQIPPDGRINIVSPESELTVQEVRSRFREILPLKSIRATVRGWTLDVLNAVRDMKKTNFSLQDVYMYEHRLSVLHPENRNIRPKIRQQLQVLRDLGLVEFFGNGLYSIIKEN
jgi:type II restriction enzyme